jgi:phosphomethylpyrimidine synthase
MCGPQFCSMKITEEVKEAMNQKSGEFLKTGAEIYVKQ